MESMKFNWKFQRGAGVETKWRYRYVLE